MCELSITQGVPDSFQLSTDQGVPDSLQVANAKDPNNYEVNEDVVPDSILYYIVYLSSN
jgi:hypothetical protein